MLSLNTKRYFSKELIQPLVLALLFLSPPYLGCLIAPHLKILLGLETFLAPLSMLACLLVKAKQRVFFGFCVGLGLFYWCALSFRYNDYPFFMPLIIILVALCYAGVFYLVLYQQFLFYRVVTLWLTSYIHPFGFDWLVPDAFFAYSLFKVDKLHFLMILIALALYVYKNPLVKPFYMKSLASLILLFCLEYPHTSAPLKGIKPIRTHVNQENKWQHPIFENHIHYNLEQIQQAIKEHQKIVILPETAFSIALNQSNLLHTLIQLGQQITIITGALYKENHTIYNSTYIFHDNTYNYAHKVILAPFGETMPFPKFIADYLDRFFFGSEVFSLGSAPNFTDFNLNGFAFRPLVCYEGTSQRAYTNSPPHLIVVSNNAWFVPSIEPFLQRMLLKYYARRFSKTIIHSVNKSPAYILSPTLLGDQNF
ncbi:apolipoprotein N-acyltransferase [Helicobacter suis]|uniref:Apolipoprotein N-acyltransferase n=2 Tax=Helicobacter suis TaxID=104628 RepID=E7G3B4_9HELI|nr:apolipoprotein N-acyltransferase [Helicobacter suis]EFX42134.1 apolipoprotein N-acyltransferase [Helicobacter suis HS5]BCD45509.1 Apolipoprotein N-acyltransferase Int [Helicobacter suis]BCD47162.1 Apolipoprotein N-acyltransferase Int [Helicobacter suis]BCD48917.1 Apolipoprotein N-acyltransferase Int [Helicobacter suis]BCD50701.1 Apolipoprotein N-acyltransferase Int [Helicobacter suis]